MFCCGGSKKSRKITTGIQIEDTSTRISLKTKSYTHAETATVTTRTFNTPPENSNLMENPTILKAIFHCLTVNELLKLRLVSKSWNSQACEALREKIEGVIILQRGLEHYTKVMSSSLDIPIGRVFLNLLDMRDPVPKNFFRKLGHSVYHLVLNLEGHSIPEFQSSLCYLQNMKQLSLNLFTQIDRDLYEDSDTEQRRQNIVSQVFITVDDYDEDNNNTSLVLHLPKLESIILSCEPNWKLNEPFLLEQLIKGSPKLKNLNLQQWPFPLTQELLQKAPLETLTFLSVPSLADADLRILASKRLPLKTIDCNVDYDMTPESLDAFLVSVSPSLEYIRVANKSNQALVFRLPTRMPKLSAIRLTTWMGPIFLDTLAGNCENLLKIQLSNCNPGRISAKNPKSNKNVKYLAVNFGHFSTVSPSQRSDAVRQLVGAFPNLETFMMRQVSDKILGQIVNGWPRLKTLRVTSAFGLTDSGLTGIPVAELSKMTKLEYKLSCECCLPVPVVDFKPCVDNLRKYPHIGKLKNLQDLSIESEEGSHFQLTNFSLHLGVHELAQLRSLKITCHNPNENDREQSKETFKKAYQVIISHETKKCSIMYHVPFLFPCAWKLELGPHWCFRCIADNLPYLEDLTVMDRAISHDRYGEHEVLYLLRKLSKLKLHLTPIRNNDRPDSQYF